MSVINPMKIVLIEDDVSACKDFKDYAGTRTDIVLTGVTGNSYEGFEIVKNKLPDAVVLDLELNMGAGSGYDFLEEFFKTEFDVRPIIVVTTRNRNFNVHTHLHAKYNLCWIFYKQQPGYGPDMVVRHLLRFREFYHLQSSDIEITTVETPEELKDRVASRIKAELNTFGISSKLKGRTYLEEAIFMLTNKKRNEPEQVFKDIAIRQKNKYDNVIRAIQTAINDAWNNTDDIEKLLMNYTAPIRKERGTPSPTEFIHYYADKIRRDIF
ncbi:MAG: hypothetical protein FWG44_01785 [Oscillospiraceae bacterium]|nr:hypothetical protein [Oscillospiraceae bacterium]